MLELSKINYTCSHTIGNTIVVFGSNKIHIYDTEENKWLHSGYDTSPELKQFGCTFIKVHRFLD